MESKKPMVLLCEELLTPLNDTLNEYDDIRNDLENIDKESLLKSIFVYIFALFEVSLNHTLEYFLKAQPKKLGNKEIKIDRDILIENAFSQDIINNEVEEYVIRISYLSLVEYIKEYCRILSINPDIEEELISKLIEKKATRNLLLHNNLKINNKYNETAWKNKRRCCTFKDSLLIDKVYVLDTIQIISELLSNIKVSLENKYLQYTKEKVLRDVWKYLFKSPIMDFDSYWIVNDGKVRGFNIEVASKYINNLSSSEKTILSIWLMQFSPSIIDKYYKFADLSKWVSLISCKDDIAFLLDILNKHPYLLNG